PSTVTPGLPASAPAPPGPSQALPVLGDAYPRLVVHPPIEVQKRQEDRVSFVDRYKADVPATVAAFLRASGDGVVVRIRIHGVSLSRIAFRAPLSTLSKPIDIRVHPDEETYFVPLREFVANDRQPVRLLLFDRDAQPIHEATLEVERGKCYRVL